MQTEIEIKGIDELRKKLSKVQAEKVFNEVFPLITDEIMHEAGKYPAETSANVPSTGTWYRRGTGRMQGTKAYDDSEDLLGQWYAKTSLAKFQAKIGNLASYAKYVHGDVQAKFHGARGWKKLTKVVKSYKREIEKELKRAVNRRLR